MLSHYLQVEEITERAEHDVQEMFSAVEQSHNEELMKLGKSIKADIHDIAEVVHKSDGELSSIPPPAPTNMPPELPPVSTDTNVSEITQQQSFQDASAESTLSLPERTLEHEVTVDDRHPVAAHIAQMNLVAAAAVSSDWEEHEDAEGTKYYFSPSRNESQWEVPDDFVRSL